MSELWVQLLPTNHVLQYVGKIVFDQKLDIVRLYLIDMLNGWEESIIWLPQEDLSQIAFAAHELQIVL